MQGILPFKASSGLSTGLATLCLGDLGVMQQLAITVTTAQLHCYAVIFECSRYIRDRQPDVLYEWFIRWFNFLTMTPEA